MGVIEEAKQLRRVPLFSNLDDSKLKLIAFTSEYLNLTDGEFLFHYNDPSDAVFLILDGALEVMSESDDGEMNVLFSRSHNDLIGEMGVILNSPRSASIRASGTATLLRIESETFLSLLSSNLCMSMYVMRELSDRLVKSHQLLSAAKKAD